MMIRRRVSLSRENGSHMMPDSQKIAVRMDFTTFSKSLLMALKGAVIHARQVKKMYISGM